MRGSESRGCGSRLGGGRVHGKFGELREGDVWG